jgi:hypothetical protein
MNWYNFLAQRSGDRNDSGVATVDGYGSPYQESSAKVRVRTNIEPTTGPALPESFDIDNPGMAQGDLRGVSLSSPVPNHIKAGQPVTIAGRVTATDRTDFSQLAILFVNYETKAQVPAFGTISRSGDFTATVTFTDAQKGRYMAAAILFYPGSGSQSARSLYTPIFVE